MIEIIELPAKLLDYFLRSNKSNINQSTIPPHLVREFGLFWYRVGKKLEQKNGGNRIFDEVTPVAKRERDPQTNWMRPAPMRMIG